MVQGLLQIVFAVSSIIGPVLGGLFAEGVGWRWIFWVRFDFRTHKCFLALTSFASEINLPIGAFSFIGIFFFLKVHPHRTDSIMHKLKTLDWFGAISITAATVLLLVGLTFGGQPQYGWTNPGTLVCIVLGVFLYPSFVLAEWKAGPEAMIPLALFRIRNFSLIAVSAFFLGISMFAPTYYVSASR
jgi:MFS family permease